MGGHRMQARLTQQKVAVFGRGWQTAEAQQRAHRTSGIQSASRRQCFRTPVGLSHERPQPCRHTSRRAAKAELIWSNSVIVGARFCEEKADSDVDRGHHKDESPMEL
ncbi:unnamed protein product [Urochloa humidicola]